MASMHTVPDDWLASVTILYDIQEDGSLLGIKLKKEGIVKDGNIAALGGRSLFYKQRPRQLHYNGETRLAE